MMKMLNDILKGSEIKSIQGNINIPVTGICFDSRKLRPGDAFVAIKGTRTDGHLYIKQAVDTGAAAVIYEDPSCKPPDEISSVRVGNASAALGIIASAYYDNPSGKLKLIGVTGTNGKTTTVTLLLKLFNLLGLKSGCFTTICNYIGDECLEATHTTPDPVQLNSILQKMINEGCSYAFMEVSSHAVVQNRISGLSFKGGVFSNITHDHLDYHNTFSEYIAAKKAFFDQLPADSFAIVNSDDRNSRIMVQNTKAKVYDYALKSIADFKAKILESHTDGMLLQIDHSEMWTRLIGEFNAYNILAVYACARLLDIPKEDILKSLSSLKTVTGRFEYSVSPSGSTAIIDYAHTPDALKNVLQTIAVIRKENGKIITVVGAGGNRDKTKRPKMAQIAMEMSDMLILTSDNPRYEEPEQIIEDMKNGVDSSFSDRLLVITDRKEAIKTACLLALKNDIILIAGKGHETYQEINGVRHHFSDMEIVREIFSQDKNNRK